MARLKVYNGTDWVPVGVGPAGGAGGSQDLQSVTDLGATTDNTITQTSSPAFTYTLGQLTNITYANGTTKDFTYNVDGTLDTLTITYLDATVITKTYVWSSGVLTDITIV